MGSVNNVTLIGHCAKQPEIRSMQNGSRVANFSLATSETWTKDGERKSQTHWHNICILNDNLVKVVESFITKGSQVYVSGQLQYRKFTDKQGNEKTVSEIVLKPYKGELQVLDKKQTKEEVPSFTPNETTAIPEFDEIPF